MKTINIDITDRSVPITKLSLKKTANLVVEITKLPENIKKDFKLFNENDVDAILAKLPLYVADGLPYLSGVVSLAFDSEVITPEFLEEECAPDDIVLLVDAWIELNNVKFLIERLKKGAALYMSTAQKSNKESLPNGQ